MSTFSERLVEARTAKGVSANEIAQMLGVSVSTYYNWEHEISKPRHISTQKTLAELLGVTEMWLSSGVGEKSAQKKAEAEVQAKLEKRDRTEFCVRSKDVRMLEDIEFVIKHLREINASRDEKEACYLTLAELRNDIECRVVLGVRPTA